VQLVLLHLDWMRAFEQSDRALGAAAMLAPPAAPTAARRYSPGGRRSTGLVVSVNVNGTRAGL